MNGVGLCWVWTDWYCIVMYETSKIYIMFGSFDKISHFIIQIKAKSEKIAIRPATFVWIINDGWMPCSLYFQLSDGSSLGMHLNSETNSCTQCILPDPDVRLHNFTQSFIAHDFWKESMINDQQFIFWANFFTVTFFLSMLSIYHFDKNITDRCTKSNLPQQLH